MRIPDASSIPFRVSPLSAVELKPVARARQATPAPDGVAELRRAADRLVAGQVRGPVGGLIDVSISDRAEALVLHPRPADRHAAATGVELGRRIDITA